MNMAQLVGARGKCSRDRVGAVIVSAENEMISVGYNGPPSGFPTEGQCQNWCPRAISAAAGEALDPNYHDCYSLHAETNAILRAPIKPLTSGSIYVSSSTCWQCGVMIANSGLTRVVMRVKPSHRYRNPDKVVEFLVEAGLEVVVWGETIGKHRAIFIREYGLGPHRCYFCDVVMPWPETIHHKDHDHGNNDPENLAASHSSCHSRYHRDAGATFTGGGPRVTVTTRWERKKPLLQCGTCDLVTVPGWLKRHAEALDHDASAYYEWKEEQERIKREKVWLCSCGRDFPKIGARNFHLKANPDHRPVGSGEINASAST